VVRGAFRKTTFHFFLIDERVVDSRTPRSAPDPIQQHVYGFVVRVLRHKLAAERFSKRFCKIEGLQTTWPRGCSGLLVLGLIISLFIVNVDFVVHCQIEPREIR
jgi:hypothetical protein